jgi:hypothetical protein
MMIPMLADITRYIHWATKAPRGLSADLFLLSFLEKELGPGNLDVLTDHEVSANPATLHRYDVLISSTHPEYVTFQQLGALRFFMQNGGRYMYLGGNGFYWVTAHSASQGVIEVRRGQSGCRSFELEPGEGVHSLTGEQGGLWRGRGLPPNALVGVGSVACSSNPGVSYYLCDIVRTSGKCDALFVGINKNVREIGQFGLFGRPASGDEIDCANQALGTPAEVKIIATTHIPGHSHPDEYGLFSEEVKGPIDKTTTTCGKVRSDILLWTNRSGGKVFSVGSIDWVRPSSTLTMAKR